eukprot:450442_1
MEYMEKFEEHGNLLWTTGSIAAFENKDTDEICVQKRTIYGSLIIDPAKRKLHKWQFKIKYRYKFSDSITIGIDESTASNIDRNFANNMKTENYGYCSDSTKISNNAVQQYGAHYRTYSYINMILDFRSSSQAVPGELSFNDYGVAFQVPTNKKYKLAVSLQGKQRDGSCIELQGYSCIGASREEQKEGLPEEEQEGLAEEQIDQKQNDKIQQLKQQNAELIKNVSDLQIGNDELNKTIVSHYRTNKREIESLQNEKEEMSKIIEQLQHEKQEMEEYKETINKLKSDLNNEQMKNKHINAIQDQKTIQINEYELQIEQQKTTIQSLNKEKVALEKEKIALEKNNKEKTTQITVVTELMNKLKTECKSLNNRINVFENEQKEYEINILKLKKKKKEKQNHKHTLNHHNQTTRFK